MKSIGHRGMYEEEFMFPQTYNTYSEYKSIREESEIRYMIHRKYLKMLGHFIETMYPGLRFDIVIRNRDLKERKPDWYGHTYMVLIIFDVITSPVYNPNTFEPSYRTPHCGEYFNGEILFNDIDSYLPEINKHLLISFSRIRQPENYYNSDHNVELPDFECWRHYYMRDSRKREMNRGYSHF